ncbi:MAG: metal-dependent hydrolase [Rhodomicrobium sp.]|nr:metal-dependent hydrolase [Rhodomicrobium sp.]
MKLTWFGHSAVRAESGSHVILIDPFLSHNPKFQGSVEEAARGATHVVLTHGHDDHVGDAASICKNTGATLAAVFELAMFLSGQGVEKVEPGNPGGSIDLGGGVSVSFVKAFHSSSTTANGKTVYLGNPCGVVIEGLGKTIYHMGDTEIFGDMALIEEIFAPKIGFVPIGDRFTMGATTAALACRKFFKFDAVVPIHYGTFPIIDQDPAKFVAAMAGQNVVIPEIGRAFEA